VIARSRWLGGNVRGWREGAAVAVVRRRWGLRAAVRGEQDALGVRYSRAEAVAEAREGCDRAGGGSGGEEAGWRAHIAPLAQRASGDAPAGAAAALRAVP
jgi:hypothetical protein